MRLAAAVCVTATCMAAAGVSIASAAFPVEADGWECIQVWGPGTLHPGGCSLYRNKETGEVEAYGNVTKERVETWDRKQWEEYKSETEDVGKNMSVNGTPEQVERQIIEDTPGTTRGEAEDAANLLLRDRPAETALTEGERNAFTTLGDETGGMLTWGQFSGALGLGIGGLTLGPTAFKLGLDLGNGLDEFFGFPTWEEYEKEDASTVSSKECKVEFQNKPKVGEVVSPQEGEFLRCSPFAAESFDRITYCNNGKTYDEGWYYPPKGEVAEGPGKTFTNGEVCFRDASGKPLPEPYSGRTVERASFDLLCYTVIAGVCTVKQLEDNKQPAPGKPMMPEPGPLGPAQEKVNTEHGIPAHPSYSPKHERKSTISPKKARENWCPPPECEEPEQVTPEQEKSLRGELETQHENLEKSPGGSAYPGPRASPNPGQKHIEENQLNAPEYEGEKEAEPEAAPLFEAPKAELKLPSFGAACKSFPFGVPCWLVKTIEGWSAVGKAPVVTIPFLGGKTGLTVNFAVVEPVMEVVRPVFLMALIIGLVVTFFSFAIGGSGGDD